MRRQDLTGRWVHAHEEDAEGRMVFRAGSVDLPPARARLAIELFDDGTYAGSGYGPVDLPESSSDAWDLVDDVIDLHGDLAQGLPRRMKVLRAEPDRLVVDPVDPG